MDFCLNLFNKSIDDLEYNDIVNFFLTEREETENLEFKSGQPDDARFDALLNKKIIRSIASFLNSSGGVLIWGTPVETSTPRGNSYITTAIGDLVPNKVLKSKDALISQIHRAISYMPTGIRLKIVSSDDGNDHVYVFEVQESLSKPHQYNGEYLIRLDGQTSKAPHYLVNAMFNQVVIPEVEGVVNFSEVVVQDHAVIIEIQAYLHNFDRLISDKNASIRLVVHPGYFHQSDTPDFSSAPKPLLKFGNPIRIALDIIILHESLQETNNIVELIYSFGGELSPAKSARYTLDLSDVNSGKFDFEKYVGENFYENKTYAELQDELGKTKESTYKAILDRLKDKEAEAD